MELTQQNKTDLLEVVIILAMFFLIIVIYVPVAIWEEEEYYQDLSRYRKIPDLGKRNFLHWGYVLISWQIKLDFIWFS